MRSPSIAAFWILALATPGAVAQGSAPAAKLFEEGRALAEQGKYEEACERYARSYELERAAGTMLNLGDCAEREGKFRDAWLMYDGAAHEYDQAGKARPAKFARDRADALASKLATIVVRLAEPRAEGLTVRIGGREVPAAAEIVERLDGGAVPIEVGAPGRDPFATTATGVVGDQIVVDVPALHRMDTVALPPPAHRPVGTRRRRRRVLLAAGVGGAGAISLGLAGLYAIRARAANREYQDKRVELGCIDSCSEEGLAILDPLYDRAAARADLATGFVIGGGVLLAGAAILYFTAPREPIRVAPIAAPGGAGVAAVIRF